jgi:hypothetical protein
MTTRTVGWAVSWEYWRRGTMWFVPAVAGLAILCTTLLYSALLWRTGLRYADLRHELDDGLAAFVVLPAVVLAIASWTASRRNYTLPVSTPVLVAWTLLNGSLASATLYAIVAIVLSLLLGADWPLLVPACWAATSYALLQSLVWWVGRSRGLLVLLVGLFVGLVAPFILDQLRIHLRQLDGDLVRMAPNVPGGMLTVLVPAWLISYLVSVNGVARDRRGDGWTLDWLAQAWKTVCDWGGLLLRAKAAPPAPPLDQEGTGEVQAVAATYDTDRVPCAEPAQTTRPKRKFRSPQSAQFWLEWRAKGRMVPLSVMVCLAWLWIWFSIATLQPSDVDAAWGGLSGIMIVLAPLVGLHLGADSGQFNRRPFSTTRPLSDGDQAFAVLKNVALVVGGCTAIWLLGLAVTYTVMWPDHGAWQKIQQAWAEGPGNFCSDYALPFAYFVLFVWTLCALGASLALARGWLVALVGLGVPLLLTVVLWIASQGGPLIETLLVATVGSAFQCAAVILFAVARVLRLISTRTIVACLAGYVVLVVSVPTALGLGSSAVERSLALGLCAAPFIPLAAAPCALYWNRHR